MRVSAIVLCGGQSSRFGSDKTAADLGGQPVLDALLSTLPVHWDVVCVGPARPTRRTDVRWTREHPPGGGPVAGLAAGLASAAGDTVVLLGGDMPYAAAAASVLARRLEEDPTAEAVVGTQVEGGRQPLLAAYRIDALRAAMPAEPSGTPLRRLLDSLVVREVPVAPEASIDVDTPEELERARHRLEP